MTGVGCFELHYNGKPNWTDWAENGLFRVTSKKLFLIYFRRQGDTVREVFNQM